MLTSSASQVHHAFPPFCLSFSFSFRLYTLFASLSYVPVKTHAFASTLHQYVCAFMSIHSRVRRTHQKASEEEKEKKKEWDKEREREKGGWLIRTCVMTIANHLLKSADIHRRTTFYLLTIAKGSFKSESERHIIVYFVNPPRSRLRYLDHPVSRRSDRLIHL